MSSNNHNSGQTGNNVNSEFNSSFNKPYNNVTGAPNSPIKGAIVMLFAILVSISGMLAAANSYGNADQSKKHKRPDFEAISTQLQLTEEQTEQLKTLLKSHHENRMQERQSQQQKRQGELQAKRESHKQALDNELSAFLNDEQITDLHEALQKNRPPRPLRSTM
jgi:hypothetical protein